MRACVCVCAGVCVCISIFVVICIGKFEIKVTKLINIAKVS